MTVVRDGDGAIARKRTDCVDKPEVQGLLAALVAATWIVETPDHACTVGPRFTDYSWNGRKRYTDRGCSAATLDHDSRSALDAVAATLAIPDDLDGGNPSRPHIFRPCFENHFEPGCD